jgi:glycerate kinase
MARARGIPVVAISGSLGGGFGDVHAEGIDAALAITSAPMTLEESSRRAAELAASAAEQAMRLMAVGARVLGAD